MNRHRSGVDAARRKGVRVKAGSPAYPAAETASSASVGSAPSTEEAALRIAHLPKEAGWALITAGVIGLAVPGVVGAPFLLAGAIVLAPGGSKLLARWAPRSATRQLGRFLDDLERRFPRRQSCDPER
jgi:hypothetical protein